MQRAEFETKLNRVCLHIYKEEHYEEDYQMPMLRQNHLDGILKVEGCEVDGKARYTYEISGMTSMKTMYENANIKKREIEEIITRILEVTETLQCYMLNPNCLVLRPEYIFYRENNWYFCYFPDMEEELCKMFHELTEYFVKMLDYQDTEGIFLAYELHKATLQEHYDLELIMKEYRSRESGRKKMIREKQKHTRYKRENGEKSSRKPDGAGTENREQEGVGYKYGKQDSLEYNYGTEQGEGSGNIFSVINEDKCEQIYTVDTICEDKGGGWWKSWRKAANGIRRKRWGSWEDLILETDGQEEES